MLKAWHCGIFLRGGFGIRHVKAHLTGLWRTHAHEKKTKAATDSTDCCVSGMESSMKSV